MANKSFQGLFSPLEVVSTNALLKIQQDQCKVNLSRIYYSVIFKIFYLSLVALSLICIGITLLENIPSGIVFLIELTVTLMLIFDTVFRGFMLGWLLFIKQFWNILDLLVNILSICLFWIGFETKGGIGEIDSITAILIIIVRTAFQFSRLVLTLRKKKEQDIQIIDLNGISEGDEVHQHTDKNFKIPNVAENRKKKSFEDCEDESQQ